MLSSRLEPVYRAVAVLALAVWLPAAGQTVQATSSEAMADAYRLLAAKQYDAAIERFRAGLAANPQNAAGHKDLAYTLLKVGDTEAARGEFALAQTLQPADETAALEYAFLCYETKQAAEARRAFDRLRRSADPQTRATAERAFQNIDGPLAAGIQRWRQALAAVADPRDLSTFSAHFELAQLAEQRDELDLAAAEYAVCRMLKPNLPSLLLDLARVWRGQGKAEQANAALLAASRGREPRTAVRAANLFGTRYPYAYEFLAAIALDPPNVNLRRELAFLYLAMHKEPDAIEQFERLLAIDATDKVSIAQLEALRRPRASRSEPAPTRPDAKTMGLKSLSAGFLRDAIRYLHIANETDPADAEVLLKLGWAYNMAGNDREAVHWFDRARHSDDSSLAAEAQRAWRNLTSGGQPALTLWFLPLYSSRWNDAFSYGQIKYTLPAGRLLPVKMPVTFYVSTRVMGDLRSTERIIPGGPASYLSETAFVFGIGATTRSWHHLIGWAEAGESVKYLTRRRDVGAAVPDWRGGVNFAWARGQLAGSKTGGWFYETTGDAVYISRFDKDWLFYSQHRAGRTLTLGEGSYLQALWNANATHDWKRQYWANTVETGPGLRLRLPSMPPHAVLSADFLHGVYTNNAGNPRRPNYNDIRVGMWYAFSR